MEYGSKKKKTDEKKRNQTLTILKILNAFCIGLAEIPRIKKGNNSARYLFPAMIVYNFGILFGIFDKNSADVCSSDKIPTGLVDAPLLIWLVKSIGS